MAYIGKSPTAAPLTSSDVADGIITNAKLAQDIISADTALGATPADTDEFLVSDAGTLKRVDYSYIKGGGQWEHLLTQTASSSSSLDFSSTYITTTYLDYMLVFSGIKLSADGLYPRLLFSVDNGSNYLDDYRNARMGLTDDNTGRNISQTGSAACYMVHENSVGNSTGEGYNAVAFVFDPLKQSGTTDIYTMMRSLGSYTDTSGKIGTFSSANTSKVATAINNIRFDLNSGNITSGKASLYGRKIS